MIVIFVSTFVLNVYLNHKQVIDGYFKSKKIKKDKNID